MDLCLKTQFMRPSLAEMMASCRMEPTASGSWSKIASCRGSGGGGEMPRRRKRRKNAKEYKGRQIATEPEILTRLFVETIDKLQVEEEEEEEERR